MLTSALWGYRQNNFAPNLVVMLQKHMSAAELGRSD